MCNSIFQEILLIITLLVQSYDSLDVKLLKDFNVFLRVVTVSLTGIPLFDGTHESHELAGDNPIDVSVLDSLVVFVLLYVEGPEIVPLEFNCVFQALEAL